MAEYRVTRQISPEVKLVFTWSGGTYIDVARYGYAPVEVINVWDYENDKAAIPFTKPAMRRAVDDWIKEYPKEELIRDVAENWRGW